MAVENTSLSTADGYDPAVERFSEKPSRSYDVVTCIDVLEHLDKDSIGAALKQIKQFTKKFFFYCIDLVPSSKSLSDGRNAHTLLAPPDWWCQKIKNEFLIATFIGRMITFCRTTGVIGTSGALKSILYWVSTSLIESNTSLPSAT